MGAQATQYTVTRLCPVFHKQSRRREVCRIFLPELVPELVPGLYRRRWDLVDEVQGWEEELERVIRRTLTACCLVCCEWNKLFTPLLHTSRSCYRLHRNRCYGIKGTQSSQDIVVLEEEKLQLLNMSTSKVRELEIYPKESIVYPALRYLPKYV